MGSCVCVFIPLVAGLQLPLKLGGANSSVWLWFIHRQETWEQPKSVLCSRLSQQQLQLLIIPLSSTQNTNNLIITCRLSIWTEDSYLPHHIIQVFFPKPKSKQSLSDIAGSNINPMLWNNSLAENECLLNLADMCAPCPGLSLWCCGCCWDCNTRSPHI